MVRFEVTEDPTDGYDGERISYVPGRGVYRTSTGANGDIIVGEEQLRALVATARTAEDYAHTLDSLTARPGTRSSSPTATPATAPRSPGSTRSV